MELKNKYYLMRHGQTIYQKEGRALNYEPDSPHKLEITEEGREMVRKSAEELRTENIDIIFTSSFLRTKQSAEIVADILGINKINSDDRIVDIDLGEFMGKPYEESTVFYLTGDKLFDNRPKGGESWNDILERVKKFINEIEEKYKNKKILIISHADPIWLMACYLKGHKTEAQILEARKDKNFYPKVAQLIKI